GGDEEAVLHAYQRSVGAQAFVERVRIAQSRAGEELAERLGGVAGRHGRRRHLALPATKPRGGRSGCAPPRRPSSRCDPQPPRAAPQRAPRPPTATPPVPAPAPPPRPRRPAPVRGSRPARAA